MLCKAAVLDYWHDKGKKLDKTDTEGINLLPDVIKKLRDQIRSMISLKIVFYVCLAAKII